MGSTQSRSTADEQVDHDKYLQTIDKDEVDCVSAVRSVVQSGLNIGSTEKERLTDDVLKPLKKLYNVLRSCFGTAIGNFVKYKLSSATEINQGFQDLVSDILDLQESVQSIGQKIEKSSGKSAFSIFVGLLLAFFSTMVKLLKDFVNKIQKMLGEGERLLMILFGQYESEANQFQSNLKSACSM